MTDDEAEGFEEADRHSSKRRYYSILRTIKHKGSDKPGMSAHALLCNRKSAGHRHKDVRASVRKAISNGDLVKIYDRDGTTRYVRTKDDEDVREAIEWLVEADDVDREAIGRLNAALSRE